VDFVRNEAQEELAALSRRILDGVTLERLHEAEAAGGFDAALWADLAGAGILAAALPESAGGAGLGLLEQCSILTELGRAVAPAPYLASIGLGAGAVAAFGSAEQHRRWAEPAARGEVILTAALAEEDSDDPAAPAVRAQSAGGRWRLSGVKTAVPAGTRADLLLVPAATGGGVAVFLVEPSDAGVTVQPQQLTGGPAARVELADADLPGSRVLGEPAAGPEITAWLAARATVGLCALQAGVTERALELTAAYARTREQFGKPIGGFQAVAQRLADAYIDVEAIRLTMWQAAWRLSAGLPADTEIAVAKFWAADAGHRVAHTAVHVHGGMGVDLSYPLHRYFTAATDNEFTLGGATTHLRRIGATIASADRTRNTENLAGGHRG
jgi:alkylation response protein AidB-like acyl-CoA dehydrogenase